MHKVKLEHGAQSYGENTGHVSALGFLQSQYNTCQEKHTVCRANMPVDAFMPTRLVDVRHGGELVHLLERPEKASYVTLSHCWGGLKPFALTKSTATQLKDGILISCLPKTFQDAIAVTRKFQMRYIWIDTLCIFQDDVDGRDWAFEAGRMKDTYKRAAFCIAATAAENGNAGLFYERDLRALTPIKINFEPGLSSSYATTCGSRSPLAGPYWIGCEQSTRVAIDSACLNRRAWVAQERYLSPRIMHFTQETLFWECHESFRCEFSRHEISWGNRAHALKPLISNFRERFPNLELLGQRSKVVAESTNLRNQFYDAWRNFRTAYTHCGMSKESDVLVALQGVSQDVAEVLNERMIAGLLESHLVAELCWYNSWSGTLKDSHRPAKWRAPSWSWASTMLPIGFGSLIGLKEQHDMIKIIDSHVESRPSGELIQASLWIECRPLAAEIRGSFIHIDGVTRQQSGNPTLDSNDRVYVMLDDPIPNGKDEKNIRNVYIVIVRHVNDGNGIEGLVLVPCEEMDEKTCNPHYHHDTRGLPYLEKSERFQRIGICDTSSLNEYAEYGKRLLIKHEQTESRIIELV
ncbi:HET-domain-containing protein [Cucurbitaria berberidis CBS 394.84]|uniref:HET-domain-containing protein n=1 Tax=Cucurbitaria berberidis CBS 394.84 TaxID=1168544 RepID=A0A9P4GE92_9PLEO|nr:HET-domain-containing protein [Cucurbitaria berberidis CBS 394.84]KAF1844378.1 HET-domain-containing protein [Cucurbitaria berberidis CBS 394.84]